ncbi:hypothetical protein PGT21_029935 [Puccinia graminis f. sp. tritici]|uniref:UV radiation resistance-associated protein n=1 Tax=Puccinia graminis f. sp. tritici TaxID=56615 RepID=A0A5B0MQJ0_PUCGR|nr:hypothetical protein PGT21_029935 [Puccinia graminis f. sp. tritici]
MEEEEELKPTQEEIRIVERTLKVHARENSQFHLSRKLSEIHQNLDRLNSQQTSTEIRLLRLQDQLRQRQGELKRRRKLNEAARDSLTEARLKNLIEKRERLLGSELPQREACRRELSRRRSELVVDLSTIYPIEPISPSASASSSTNNPSVSRLLLFSIANIILPNLEPTQSLSNKSPLSSAAIGTTGTTPSLMIQFFNSKPLDLADDDLIVSTALGFVAHLVQLLALYLAVPLLYPVNFIGSRSLVSDLVSRIPGPRSFPLYFKGVDRFRFEYAVFLLNKNIEQILYHQKVVVSDLRHTLPNLKNLFLTLESSPITRNGENENDTSTIELDTSDNHVGKEEGSQSHHSPSTPRGADHHPDSLPRKTTLSLRSSSSKVTARLPLSPPELPPDDHQDQYQPTHDNDDDHRSLKSSPSSSLSPSLPPSREDSSQTEHVNHIHNVHSDHSSPSSPSPSPPSPSPPSLTTAESLHIHRSQPLHSDLNLNLHLPHPPPSSPSEKNTSSSLHQGAL